MGLQIENMSADETLRAKPTSLQETYRHLPLKCFAEFMAMLVFVFIGCGTAMVQPRPENADGTPMSNAVLSGDSSTNPAVFQICLAFGMAILCLVYSTCGISGGHLNPAVTTALMISGHHPIVDGVLYIIAQLCGSCVAAMLLAATIPDGMDQSGAFATNSVASGFSDGNAFCGEFMMTCLLLFVVYHTAVYRDQYKSTDAPWDNKVAQFAPLAIGMAVFVAHCVLVPITGCSINPARTLGPLIVGDVRGLPNDDPWNDVWIFMVAPLCASLVVGLLYCFYEKQDQDCPHRKGSAQPHLIAELPKSPEVTTQVNPLPLPTMQAAAPAEHSEPRQFNNSSGKMRRSSDKPSQAQPMVDDTAVII